MATAGTVWVEAQALLNDVAKSIWTDAVLLPFLQKAHRELQVMLWENGLDVIKEISAVISVAVNATTLGAFLPTDIITPITLEERPDAETLESRWRLVAESDFLPNVDPSTAIQYWNWREEIISFIAPTTARKVRLKYLKGLTVPTVTGSPIGFIFGEMYLGPRTASLACASVGNTTRADELNADAAFWIPKILATNVKQGQAVPTRRVPYRRSLRRFIVSRM